APKTATALTKNFLNFGIISSHIGNIAIKKAQHIIDDNAKPLIDLIKKQQQQFKEIRKKQIKHKI
ncbi:MAG: hypothetical protein M3Z48_07455, partial [Lactobacillus sp.]|nr:hypothetical protein [Lactobacillus sp.]